MALLTGVRLRACRFLGYTALCAGLAVQFLAPSAGADVYFPAADTRLELKGLDLRGAGHSQVLVGSSRFQAAAIGLSLAPLTARQDMHAPPLARSRSEPLSLSEDDSPVEITEPGRSRSLPSVRGPANRKAALMRARAERAEGRRGSDAWVFLQAERSTPAPAVMMNGVGGPAYAMTVGGSPLPQRMPGTAWLAGKDGAAREAWSEGDIFGTNRDAAGRTAPARAQGAGDLRGRLTFTVAFPAGQTSLDLGLLPRLAAVERALRGSQGPVVIQGIAGERFSLARAEMVRRALIDAGLGPERLIVALSPAVSGTSGTPVGRIEVRLPAS